MNEAEVEEAALAWLQSLGYVSKFGPNTAPDGPSAERKDWSSAILSDRLSSALQRQNPDLPQDALEDAYRKLTRSESPSLVQTNRRTHGFIVEGVPIEYRKGDRVVGDLARVVDFDHPEENDFLVVNQFTIIQDRHSRRPDLVIFLNGLPVAIIELKDPTDPNATLPKALQQIETYKREVPNLFHHNELIVLSDGAHARMGSLTSDWGRYMPWRTIDSEKVEPLERPQLEVLLKGVFEKGRLLDLLQNFIVYEEDGRAVSKKVAGYHQFHAVNRAVACTLRASSPQTPNAERRRIGVVWHSQGSGKSLTMAFYAGKIARQSGMKNPTVVVLTDRNDLDDQLFQSFTRAKALLRQTPTVAETRSDLREKLKVATGGIVFSTIQKFLPEKKGDTYPLLSDRSNIVVIADEAHRSQYDFIDGFARHLRDALPNASWVGFTGTPIELSDRNTKAVFGDIIDTYDITRAVQDEVTVPIYYESRLAKIRLKTSEVPKIDPRFEEVTEGQEEEVRTKVASKWSRTEALVGAPRRTELVAHDLVKHIEEREEALTGKTMIVCMSRTICVNLYDAIRKLRPEWCNEDDSKGKLKVVMTGSATDGPDWQVHIRSKEGRRRMADRFRDPEDPFRIVIVRDMWLTGFDAPSLHTMYLDKPMRGHGLMQTIARVNRVFEGKPGGLIVDYLGIAEELEKALRAYTTEDRREVGIDQKEAVRLLRRACETATDMFHGFDRSSFHKGAGTDRLALLAPAANHIAGLEDGKKRYLKVVKEISAAFALAVPAEEALALREDVRFYQDVRGFLIKTNPDEGTEREELDTAVRQIVSQAVAAAKVVDILSAAGLKRPALSLFDEKFLEDVRRLPYQNLALEVLQKLLNDEIRVRSSRNLVQGRLFSEMLQKAILRYQNHTLEAAQVIEELVGLAREIRKAKERGEKLGLSSDEEAFYDALEVNDSAVKVMGEETLKTIAKELVKTVRKSASIDWQFRENVRAELRVMVKRVLKKYGYPPDKQEKATQTVLQQAELLCADWV